MKHDRREPLGLPRRGLHHHAVPGQGPDRPGLPDARAGRPAPYKPLSVPGRIQAEDYDLGGEGVAYHDTTARQRGRRLPPRRRRHRDRPPASPNVGWIRNGEYLTYTANVTDGRHVHHDRPRGEPEQRAGPSRSRSTAHPVATIAVPNTGSFAAFQDVGVPITLPAGTHAFRLTFAGDGQNLDWIEFDAGHHAAAAAERDAVHAARDPRHDPGRGLQPRRRGRRVPRHHARQRGRRVPPRRRRYRDRRRHHERRLDPERRVPDLHRERHGTPATYTMTRPRREPEQRPDDRRLGRRRPVGDDRGPEHRVVRDVPDGHGPRHAHGRHAHPEAHLRRRRPEPRLDRVRAGGADARRPRRRRRRQRARASFTAAPTTAPHGSAVKFTLTPASRQERSARPGGRSTRRRT